MKLLSVGFQNDINVNLLGRYLLLGIILDVMPTDESILGFSNIWYEEGFKCAVDYTINSQHTIKIFSPPYFIASKLDAFKKRGTKNGRTSPDFEDILFVLENRRSVWEEMRASNESVLSYLVQEFKAIHHHRYIEEWVEAHSWYYSPIMEEMEKFIG